MRSEQLTVIIIAFGVLITIIIGLAMWLNHCHKVKSLNLIVELSRLEKEKMEVVDEAVRHGGLTTLPLLRN